MIKEKSYKYGNTNFKIPIGIYDVLINDCVKFGYIKGEEVNFSGFINNIIPKLMMSREDFHNELLKENNQDEDLVIVIEKNIYNNYLKTFNIDTDINLNVPFRINKDSRERFNYIIDVLLDKYDIDFTNFIRNLLFEYSIKKENQRELFYYYDYMSKIKNAIKKSEIIIVNTNKDALKFIPCSIELSKCSRFNYLCGYDESDNQTIIVKMFCIKTISFSGKYIKTNKMDDVIEQIYQLIEQEDE